jgi:hypothetical protein
MTQVMRIAYAHRHNRDGSFDSICKTCFATVGQTKDEAALAQLELTHYCPAWILVGRGSLRPTAPSTLLALVPPPKHNTRNIVV